MSTTKFSIIATSIVIIAACSSTKKSTSSVATNTTTTTSSTNTPTTTVNQITTTAGPTMAIPKMSSGFRAPGNEELAAIQVQFKDVTLEKLKEGHAIYAEGACIGCHPAKNIYRYNETEWVNIMNDMAYEAKLTPEQKDAVHKYVLSIKATPVK